MKTNVKVWKTRDYSMFRRLEGNRKVLRSRVKKIKKSIEQVGYIINPIIVNEKYEIIDGQGRLEALKELGLDVYYICEEGIGIDECISMNMNNTNWTLMDYIDSYAETGNISYVYLSQLIKAFQGKIHQKAILYVATGKYENSNTIIKSGNFQCAAEDYNRATRILGFLTEFIEPLKRLKGHTEYYFMALAFCYDDPEVDNERLLDKIIQMQAGLIPVTTILQAFEQIEEAYNNRARKKVYIKTNYKKALDSKYTWYEQKYGHLYSDSGAST